MIGFDPFKTTRRMSWSGVIDPLRGADWSVYLAGGLTLLWGTIFAIREAWTCDDAFISFRYARHLVDGMGLVFNRGEYVQGYTNFLWTLWMAAGMKLGIGPERWSAFWGIAAYAATIALLLCFHVRMRKRLRRAGFSIPMAALLAALHPDWNIYATSGLETSAYTFLLVAGFMILTFKPLAPRRLLWAGLTLGCAFLTRPDGLLPAAVAGVFVLWQSRTGKKVSNGAFYSAGILLLALPFLAWEFYYYGDIFPNTYYAKSASLTWYSQGLAYAGSYFARYWPLLFSIPIVLVIFSRSRRQSSAGRNWEAGGLFPPLALAAALAATYTFYIVRVGGDFMYARMLIPATPFYLLTLEMSTLWVLRGKAFQHLLLSGCCGAIFLVTAAPVTGELWFHGIANEPEFYSPQFLRGSSHLIDVLKYYFKDLPVRLAYLGAEARIMYETQVPVAIDCYGLTDRYIAGLPLKRRRRVGHEKLPPVPYLVHERQVNFIFDMSAIKVLHLASFIPIEKMKLDDINAVILRWNPEVMAVLKRRGAQFPDFPSQLDAYIEKIPGFSKDKVRSDFLKFRLFYFDHVKDPTRERPFLLRLSAPPN